MIKFLFDYCMVTRDVWVPLHPFLVESDEMESSIKAREVVSSKDK